MLTHQKNSLKPHPSVIPCRKKEQSFKDVICWAFQMATQFLYSFHPQKTSLPRRPNAFAHTKQRPLLSKIITFLSTWQEGKQKKRKSKSARAACAVSKFRLGPNILNITQSSQLVQDKGQKFKLQAEL